MKVAVVGATGLVGGVMLKVLAERNFPLTELLLVASERSVGKKMTFRGKEHTVIGLQDAVNAKPDIALFSAGGSTSKEWAPIFIEAGTTVIDNSSAWRMNDSKPLIVPELNADILTVNDKLIANPNCSTIQMVLALHPLQQAYGLKRVVVSTYQSVTGTGVKGIAQLQAEQAGRDNEKVYPYTIHENCLPHGGDFDEEGYTTEETKLVMETRKIMRQSDIGVTATVVRVPVLGGHSESINVELKEDFELKKVRELMTAMPGIILQDEPTELSYPMPISAQDRDEVFVGRLRRDNSQANTLNMWVVADNLRKGAATNAVQIAEYLVENKLV